MTNDQNADAGRSADDLTPAQADAVPAEEQRDPSEDAHTLAQPTELAGTADGAIAAEFARRDAELALDSDAAGAASGAELESDDLPLDGE